jgi:YHS domain-containing protein
MEVDEKDAAAVSQYEGKTYYFCSVACKDTFTLQEDERRAHVGKAASDEGSAASDVVWHGGVAQADAETEDVTRDTYGFATPASRSPTREERIRDADRAAEEAGMPGVVLPESRGELEEVTPPEPSKRTRS